MAVWTPAETTTGLWLDAADSSTITLESGAVSQWGDKSGNGLYAEQTSASARPSPSGSINGVAALEFAQTNFLTATQLSGGTKTWFFVVDGSGSTLATRSIFGARNNSYVPVAGGAQTSLVRVNGVDNPAGYSILINGEGAQSLWTRAAIHAALVAGPGLWVFASLPNILSSWDIGRGGGANTYALAGCLGEVVCVEGTPSVADRQLVEGYLAHKWGLAANLPSSHPYKSEAPSLQSLLSFSPAVHEISATGISKVALGNITSPVGAIVADGETIFTPITGTGDVVQPRPEISGYGGVFRDGIAFSPPKHEVSSRGTADIVSWGRSRQASRVSGQGHGNVLVRGWMAQSLPGISGAALVSAMGEGRVSGRQLVSSSGEINPNIAAGTMRFRQPAGSISAASMLLASCNGAFSVGRPSVRAAGELAVSCVGRVTSRRAGISAATAIATPSLVFSRDSRFAPTVSASSPVNILRFERS